MVPSTVLTTEWHNKPLSFRQNYFTSILCNEICNYVTKLTIEVPLQPKPVSTLPCVKL